MALLEGLDAVGECVGVVERFAGECLAGRDGEVDLDPVEPGGVHRQVNGQYAGTLRIVHFVIPANGFVIPANAFVIPANAGISGATLAMRSRVGARDDMQGS